MEIITQPPEAKDWSSTITCDVCMAKLKVNTHDVRHRGSKSSFEGFLVHCPICENEITIEPPWSVKVFARQST